MPEQLLTYRARPDLLDGLIVLVTGAADGIGRAVAKSFAEHGAATVLLDKKSRKLETLYDEIVAAGWPEPALLVQDLADLDVTRAAEISAGIEIDFGRLDGLLHNAGHLGALTPLRSQDATEWQTTIQVNLTAPYLLTQALLPMLRLSSSASVVFTTADVGRRAQAYWGAYAVAYGGVEALARTWAEELEQSTAIRINTLDPGAIKTAMRNRTFPGDTGADVKPPEDIVNVYLYLMGEDSRHVRGRALVV